MQEKFPKQIERAVKDGLLELDEQGLRLTRKGRFVGNEVFQQFLIEDWVFLLTVNMEFANLIIVLALLVNEC